MTHRWPTSLIAVIGALMLISLPIRATELPPYTAHYQADFDIGLSMGGDAVRQLKQLDDGSWQLSIEATTLVARIDERSHFRVDEHGITPLQYDYLRKVLGKKRQARLSFDWDNLQVTNDIEAKPWSMAIPAGTLDKVSYQLQLRRDIAAGKPELSYQVADGGSLKHYRFESLGQEQVTTPAGRYQATKVRRIRDRGSDRETLIWFAPELDYAIVKLQQVEGEGKQYQLLLERIDYP